MLPIMEETVQLKDLIHPGWWFYCFVLLFFLVKISIIISVIFQEKQPIKLSQ